MQILNSQQYLNKIRSCLLLRHPSNLPKQTEQLPSWTILHYEHIKVVSLDKIVHPNHEWMVNLLIDVSLVQHQLPTLLAGES